MKKRFIIPVLAIILIVLFLAHLSVYEGFLLIIGTPVNAAVLLAIRVIFILLCPSFVLASLLTAKWDNRFTRIFYRISAVWLGFLTYFFFATALAAGNVLISRILFALAGAVALYGVIHASTTEITHAKIALPNLPASWKNKRIVFISDVHLGQVRGEKFSQKIVQMIQELKPDIVLIGGDLYDGVVCDEKAIITPLQDLLRTVPFGVYFVTGNHEEFLNCSVYLAAVRAAGIRVLADECLTIDGLQIIGVDYHTTAKKADFEKVLRAINWDKNQPAILIKHEPADLDVAAQAGVSLQLSGHTHRAQIWPFAFLTRWIYHGYDYGLHTYGSHKYGGDGSNNNHSNNSNNQIAHSMKILTSSGVGTWGPPLRVGTRSEIVCITLI